jgi:hypothetical protein
MQHQSQHNQPLVSEESRNRDIEVKPRTARPQQKITDWEKFRAFAKEHEDQTQAQMAQLWEGDISSRTISRALQKLG